MRQLIGIGVASVLALSVLVMAQVSDEEAERLLRLYKQRNAERKAKAATQPATTRPKPDPRSRPAPKVRPKVVQETLSSFIKSFSAALGKPEAWCNVTLKWDEYRPDPRHKKHSSVRGPKQIVQLVVTDVGDQYLGGKVSCGKDPVSVGVSMSSGEVLSVEDRIRFSKIPIGTMLLVRGQLASIKRVCVVVGEELEYRGRFSDGKWRVRIIQEDGKVVNLQVRSLSGLPKPRIVVRWHVYLANCEIVK